VKEEEEDGRNTRQEEVINYIKEPEERRSVLYYLRNSRILNFEIFNSLHSRIIKHPFNYTNQMHNIYSLHTFTVFVVHVFGVIFTVIVRTVCPLLRTTCCYAAVVYVYYNSYVVIIKGTNLFLQTLQYYAVVKIINITLLCYMLITLRFYS